MARKLRTIKESSIDYLTDPTKHGRCINNGYVFIKIPISSPYFPMANKDGYVAEHRLVMAQDLGRCLSYYEVVHHKNSNRADNQRQNLVLLGNSHEHRAPHRKHVCADGGQRQLLTAYVKHRWRTSHTIKTRLEPIGDWCPVCGLIPYKCNPLQDNGKPKKIHKTKIEMEEFYKIKDRKEKASKNTGCPDCNSNCLSLSSSDDFRYICCECGCHFNM